MSVAVIGIISNVASLIIGLIDQSERKSISLLVTQTGGDDRIDTSENGDIVGTKGYAMIKYFQFIREISEIFIASFLIKSTKYILFRIKY